MDFKLTSYTALVSGSTAGIGLAIATILAQEGGSVIINGRTSERVDNAIAPSPTPHTAIVLAFPTMLN